MTLAPGRARGQEDVTTQLQSVGDVRIDGNRRLSDGAIRAVLKTRGGFTWPWAERPLLRWDFVHADTAAIQMLYRQHGFLDTRVTADVSARPGGREVDVVFHVREGERSVIRRVELEGIEHANPAAIRRRLLAEPERPFNPAYLFADTGRISYEYQDRGYIPAVIGRAWRGVPDSLDVTVQYVVREGPRYRNGEVYPYSNEELHVTRRTIDRMLLLDPDDWYRISRVEESQERLYETGLFSQVQLTPLVDSAAGVVNFDLRLQQRRPRWVDLGVGAGSAERFRFTGEWGHRNLDHRALRGVLAGRIAFDGSGRYQLSRIESSLTKPWLFGAFITGQALAWFENGVDRGYRPEYSLVNETRGLSFQLSRRFGRRSRVGLTQDNRFVHQRLANFDDTLTTAERDAFRAGVKPSYRTHRLLLDGERDQRDNPLNATRGSWQTAVAEIAGGPLQGSSSFTRTQVGFAWYMPWRGWVFATRLQGGVIRPFGDNPEGFTPADDVDSEVARVPLEDRFRIGGVNTVRGYNESEIIGTGGLAMAQGNAELRIPLVRPFGFEGFVDFGNVWERPEYMKLGQFVPEVTPVPLGGRDVHWVFGVGARLELPFGPARLDVTWSPRPKPDGEWLIPKHTPQFSIGAAF